MRKYLERSKVGTQSKKQKISTEPRYRNDRQKKWQTVGFSRTNGLRKRSKCNQCRGKGQSQGVTSVLLIWVTNDNTSSLIHKSKITDVFNSQLSQERWLRKLLTAATQCLLHSQTQSQLCQINWFTDPSSALKQLKIYVVFLLAVLLAETISINNSIQQNINIKPPIKAT